MSAALAEPLPDPAPVKKAANGTAPRKASGRKRPSRAAPAKAAPAKAAAKLPAPAKDPAPMPRAAVARDETPRLHPLTMGLFQALPASGQTLETDGAVLWLQAAVSVMRLAYGVKGSITVSAAPAA